MDTSRNDMIHDNSRVFGEAPQSRRAFWIVIMIIIGPTTAMGIFLLLMIGSSLSMAVSIAVPTNIGFALIFFGMMKYLWVYSNQIIMAEEDMKLILEKGDTLVSYSEIIDVVFSYYSYDVDGNPCPRFIAGWKKKYAVRQINLTEENAKLLAKQLDYRGIQYIWRENRRQEWEENLRKKGLVYNPSSTPPEN